MTRAAISVQTCVLFNSIDTDLMNSRVKLVAKGTTQVQVCYFVILPRSNLLLVMFPGFYKILRFLPIKRKRIN